MNLNQERKKLYANENNLREFLPVMGAKGKTVMIIIEMEIIKIITTKCFYLSAVLAYFMYSFTTFCFRTENKKNFNTSDFRCFYIETKWETKIALTFFTFLLLVFHSKIVRTAFHSLVLQYYAK